MFDFLQDYGNHDSRCVANFQEGDLVIDTARVSDGRKPFETGICSPLYNNGQWIIVEAYSNKTDAQTGHDKWVEVMKTAPPDTLKDCQNSVVSGFLDEDDLTFSAND